VLIDEGNNLKRKAPRSVVILVVLLTWNLVTRRHFAWEIPGRRYGLAPTRLAARLGARRRLTGDYLWHSDKRVAKGRLPHVPGLPEPGLAIP
jgi:hypothetical protein